MKVTALLCLLFVAFALGDTCTPAATPCNIAGTNTIDLNDWTEVTVSTVTQCWVADFEGDDTDASNTFLLAIRPGDDAAGPTSAVTVTAYGNNTVSLGCAKLMANQTAEDDSDYHCFPIASVGAPGVSGNVSVSVINTNATANATVEIFVGFHEGTTTDCEADYFSGGSSVWVWIVAILIVVVVIVIILAAVGGFLYMKKKKSSNLRAKRGPKWAAQAIHSAKLQ